MTEEIECDDPWVCCIHTCDKDTGDDVRSRSNESLVSKSKVLEIIEGLKRKIEGDERHGYKPADVFVNAPLALIQSNMDGHLTALSLLKERIEAL